MTQFRNISAYSNFDTSFSSARSAMDKVFGILGEHHRKRIQKYELNWRFYEGDHWATHEFDDLNVTLNYIKRIVDVKAIFFSKNGFDILIPEISDEEGKPDIEIRSFIKAKLDKIWELNEKSVKLMEMTQQGGVCGDVFIKVTWEEGDVFTSPHPKVTVIPSIFVFPVWDARRPGLMSECWIVKLIEVEKIEQKGFFQRTFTESTEVGLYMEKWTANTYTEYEGEEQVNFVEHNLGVIPIIHIQNTVNTNSKYGISDAEEIIPIQRVLNEKATDISDIVDYHGSPQTVMYGARPDQLERGADKIWGMPKDAKIENLEIMGDLKANLEFYRDLKVVMQDLAGVPAQAINPTNAISNTPGVALHMSYAPLVEIRGIKAILYGLGLQQVNRIILRYLELFDASFQVKFRKLKAPERYTTKVTFGEALPRDEILRIENFRAKLQMGITTRARILMEEYGLGQADAHRIIEESDADMLARREALMTNSLELDASGISSKDPVGKQRRPDPVIQGDRIMQQAINSKG